MRGRAPPDMSNRCRQCGKVIFASRESADTAASDITKKHRPDRAHGMRSYRGRCGFWHLTRVKTLREIREKWGLDNPHAA
jgi:hypothetical protein